MFVDETDTASLAYIRKQVFSGHLSQVLKLGFATNTHWFRIPLSNTSSTAVSLTYTLANRYLNHVDLYGLSSDSILFFQTYNDGVAEQENDEFLLNGIAFNFTIPAHASIELYIRISNDGDILTYTPSLYTRSGFAKKKEVFLTVIGCFFGIIFLLWIFSVFYFLFPKRIFYRYYSFYILTVILFTAHLHGFMHSMMPCVQEPLQDLVFTITLFANIFCFFGFLNSFFKTRYHLPTLHKISTYAVYLFFPILFLVLINKKDLAFNISALISTPIILLIIFVSLIRNVKASLFLISSIAVSTIAIIMSRYGGLTEDNFFTSNLFSVVFLLNMAIVFGALLKTHTQSLRKTEKQLKQRQLKIGEHNQIILEKNKELETAMQAVLKAEAERSELQEQLIESNKMETMGRLAGGIAHDFNNILTPIVGHADLALEITEEEEIKEDLKVILKSAMRAKELINQILTFSRKYKTEAYPVEVFKVIQDAMELLHASFPKNIALEYNLSSSKLFVLANEVQLQQVLLNLCTNAKDAIGTSLGLIRIKQEMVVISDSTLELKSGTYGKITISDNGSGMSEHIQKNIFFPFYTTKPKGAGTGLGLSVAHGIITSFGGSISVQSTEGKGTDFEIYLPSTEAVSPVKKNDPIEPKHSAKGETILIVDDEESIRNVITQKLQRLGYTVFAKENGKKGYEFLKSQETCIDLLITDQMMPEMTGEELIKKVRSQCFKTKIILISGYSEKLTKNIDLGANEVVMKPFSFEELTEKINTLLAKKD